MSWGFDRKKAMTSFDLAAVVVELNRNLLNSRVDNVYKGPQDAVLLKLRSARVKGLVVLEPARRAHVTKYDVAKKGVPPPFIMGLRKHIRERKVVAFEQLGFDRVLRVVFDNGFAMLVELLPRGVLALVNNEGKIVQVSETKEMRDRKLGYGLTYTPPPSRIVHPNELDPEKVAKALLDSASGSESVVKLMSSYLAYPREVVVEALHRAGLSDKPLEQLRPTDLTAALENLRQLYREALEAKGYLVMDEYGSPLTALPFEPTWAEELGLRVASFASASEAFDEYFMSLVKVEEAERAAKALEAERLKLEASLRKAEENLERLRSRAEELRELVNVLGEHYTYVEEALACVNSVRESKGWDYVVGLCPGVVDVRPSQGRVLLSVGGRLVELDIRTPLDKQMVELSKRLGEIESKISRSLRALEELKRKIEELTAEIALERRRASARFRRREWYERFHWMYTSNWLLVIGGRDAEQNEVVVKRYLSDEDIFMHADIRGAPAVVVLCRGKRVTEEDLREAACLAACYSRAWREMMGFVDVYWVKGSQVSKTPPSGEYLTKGAFMVYGQRNYIKGVRLELAIGVGVEGDAPIVIVGPEQLVRRRSVAYAVLVPGDEDPSKLAKKLKSLLVSRAQSSFRAMLDSVSVEELLQRLPGPSRVLRVREGEAHEPPRPL